jgi:O-antigen/teichoic acid export membrane protein
VWNSGREVGVKSSHRYTVLQVLAKVIGAATIVLLARGASRETLGSFIVASVVAGCAFAAFDFGMARTLGRLAATGRSAPSITEVAAPRCRAMCLIVVLSAVAAAVPGLAPTARLGALAVMLGAVLTLNAMAEALLLGQLRGGSAAIGNVAFNGASVVAIAGVLLVGGRSSSAVALFAAYTLGAFVALGVYSACLRKGDGPQLAGLVRRGPTGTPGSRAGGDRKHALKIGLVQTSLLFYYRADVLILAALAPAADVAVFAVAYRLIEVGQAAPNILISARQPAVARSAETGEAGRMVIDTYESFSAGFAILAAALLAVATLVPLIFGSTYHDSRRLLVLLVPGLLGISQSYAAFVYVTAFQNIAARRLRLVLPYPLAAVIMAGAAALGYEVHGVVGVAVAESLAELMVGVIVTLVVARELDLPLSPWSLGATGVGLAVLLLLVWGGSSVAAIAVLCGYAATLLVVRRRELTRRFAEW